jgi:ABC-2 type transport system permease protein
METIIPKTSTVITALLKADLTTQWRNRRAVMLSILMPVIILISWKGMIPRVGGPYTLANALSYGLIAIGLLGYANSVARDRDKAIFQRLRVAPIPTWGIMASRLLVQLLMIIIVTIAVFYVGYDIDHITLTSPGYFLTFFTAIVGAAVYLSVGQLIVGLIKNPETVNSTSRLVFLAFIMIGTVASLGGFENYPQVQQIANWSPYGTVNTILAAGMAPSAWNMHDTYNLLATIGYILVFTTIGINKFKWDTK